MKAALAFIIGVFLGLPLVAVLSLAALGGLVGGGHSLNFFTEAFYRGLDQLPLTAITGFVLAGSLMGSVGLTAELTSCAQKLVGRIKGSLGLVTILACLFFSALSGSGGATCAAVGAMMVPAMLKAGYSNDYAGAMAASGGVLGILIPPSIPMIIYGAQANVPTQSLFKAGILPGIILTALLLLIAWLDAVFRKLPLPDKEPNKQETILKLFWQAKWALVLPVIILGGIWKGWVTPTEAAILAIWWILLIGLCRKRLSGPMLFAAVKDAALLSGGAIILLAPATALARYLALAGMPQHLASLLTAWTTNPLTFLFLLMVFLFLCGLIADTISMIIIMTPIFLPTARALGVDPILMGIVFVLCCEAGFLTPPFGGNLFIASRLSGCDLGRLSLAALPYVAAIMLLTAAIILWPQFFIL